MLMTGCDFHTRFQQIAMLDSPTCEIIERRRLRYTARRRRLPLDELQVRHINVALFNRERPPLLCGSM